MNSVTVPNTSGFRANLSANRARESVITWSGATFRFGTGATKEIGHECLLLGMHRVLVVTDTNVVASGVVDEVRMRLRAEGIEPLVWGGAQAEPTTASIELAVSETSDLRFDGLIGLGGGSVIDTCKFINLLSTKGGELLDYVVGPHGGGREVSGSLSPMIGVPTTAGTGSECTATAMVEVTETHTKAAVSHHSIRPAVAIIDPLNTLSCPPAVTASAGYDAVVQALESYTSLVYDQRPPSESTDARPVYIGHNPISAIWCAEAIRKAGRFLTRAVADGTDVEARVGMSLAALCSRLGNAGVHIPHANGYAVASTAAEYHADGFPSSRSFVPHGQSVIATAPASFDALYPSAPERFQEAAELLGVSGSVLRQAPERAVTDWLRSAIHATGGPTSLEHFGITRSQIPEMIEKALSQQRILVGSPRPVTKEFLNVIFNNSFDA